MYFRHELADDAAVAPIAVAAVLHAGASNVVLLADLHAHHDKHDKVGECCRQGEHEAEPAEDLARTGAVGNFESPLSQLLHVR